jgi:hypothetical protein
VEKEIDYKYNEGNLLKELKEYIDATYGQHYSLNKFQATEFIIDDAPPATPPTPPLPSPPLFPASNNIATNEIDNTANVLVQIADWNFPFFGL